MVATRNLVVYDLEISLCPVFTQDMSVTPETLEEKVVVNASETIPAQDRTVFLTGEVLAFQLTVKNKTNRKRIGNLILVIRYDNTGANGDYTIFPVPIDIEPKGQFEKLMREPLVAEGAVSIIIQLIDTPEKLRNVSTADLLELSSLYRGDVKVLCTFKVMDNGSYLLEKRRHDDLLKKQDEVIAKMDKLKQEILEEVDRQIRTKVVPEIKEQVVREIRDQRNSQSENEKQQQRKTNPLSG